MKLLYFYTCILYSIAMSDYYMFLAAQAASAATMNHRHGAVIVPKNGHPLKGCIEQTNP